ncbi:MAG: hypothetical protein Cons2KO_13100 [Congregibacter sp.]
MKKQEPMSGFAEREAEVKKLRKMAVNLDSIIRLPGGYRIGFDGLLGLIPVVGDSVSALISSFIVYRAAQLGVPVHHLLRMMINIIFETLVGFIPLIGDLFDFVWKANEKNMLILEKHLPAELPRRSAKARISLASLGVGLCVLILLGLLLAAAIALFTALIGLFT